MITDNDNAFEDDGDLGSLTDLFTSNDLDFMFMEPKFPRLAEIMAKSTGGMMKFDTRDKHEYLRNFFSKDSKWLRASSESSFGVLRFTHQDPVDYLAAALEQLGARDCVCIIITASLKVGHVQKNGTVKWFNCFDPFTTLGIATEAEVELKSTGETVVALLVRKAMPDHLDDRIAQLLTLQFDGVTEMMSI